jgi:ABC-type nickel/cobalt efflux system permease component RcnA
MWFLERWLENPKTVKKLVYLLYLSLIIVSLMGVVNQFAPSAEHEVDEAHTEHEAIEEHTEHEAIEEHTEHEAVEEHTEHEAVEEHTEHTPFVFEKIPIFNAIFGLIMSVILGLGAKAYGHNIVMKEEDYYDR